MGEVLKSVLLLVTWAHIKKGLSQEKVLGSSNNLVSEQLFEFTKVLKQKSCLSQEILEHRLGINNRYCIQ